MAEGIMFQGHLFEKVDASVYKATCKAPFDFKEWCANNNYFGWSVALDCKEGQYTHPMYICTKYSKGLSLPKYFCNEYADCSTDHFVSVRHHWTDGTYAEFLECTQHDLDTEFLLNEMVERGNPIPFKWDGGTLRLWEKSGKKVIISVS